MITTFFLTAAFFLVAFFSAENLVIVIIGTIATAGLSQFVKHTFGAYGPAMVIVAVLISIVVAFAAMFISAVFNGTPLDWSSLPQFGSQLFALATIAYKLLLADSEGTN